MHCTTNGYFFFIVSWSFPCNPPSHLALEATWLSHTRPTPPAATGALSHRTPLKRLFLLPFDSLLHPTSTHLDLTSSLSKRSNLSKEISISPLSLHLSYIAFKGRLRRKAEFMSIENLKTFGKFLRHSPFPGSLPTPTGA